MNDAWRIAPWVDVLYAADGDWWAHHEGVPAFDGERWSQDDGQPGHSRRKLREVAPHYGIRVVRSVAGPGVSFDAAYIRLGFNSGFQALNLAVLFGAARIVLLGFDMQATGGRAHFFGQHPAPLRARGACFKKFIKAFNEAAPQLASAGVEVINATRETALTCFPRARIEDL